jgi:hypothetical protein
VRRAPLHPSSVHVGRKAAISFTTTASVARTRGKAKTEPSCPLEGEKRRRGAERRSRSLLASIASTRLAWPVSLMHRAMPLNALPGPARKRTDSQRKTGNATGRGAGEHRELIAPLANGALKSGRHSPPVVTLAAVIIS